MNELMIKGQMAKAASAFLVTAREEDKNRALIAMAEAVYENSDYIIKVNAEDIASAREKGLNEGFIERLTLTPSRITALAKGMQQVAELPDPVGTYISRDKRPNGLEIEKVRVPLGVIGIIYESRPNVTADAAALCLKSGNACILRGGKEALGTNLALVNIMQDALIKEGFPKGCINLVEDTSRETATALMRLNEYLDVIIPRGGAGLIRAVMENATVPAIETGTGNCHVYVDKYADLSMARDIVINAKTSRPSVCNAEEKLLVHKDIAERFLPAMISALYEEGVEVIGDERVCKISDSVILATEEDWGEEYLSLKIAIKVVDSLDEAIAHINKYGTRHSEAIVTENIPSSQKFLKEVDAAAVYVNASTRFTDGFEFGFGAEIGISTQKIHARGPMGLTELTTSKYLIKGNGQIRQ
ncbi:MAG: glutamate-5-semialdehyde dehydrogenase [Clostridia bacterium]|nr:glutamate-5-semialdehyde dehydrogenase [Clostridia bacterium]